MPTEILPLRMFQKKLMGKDPGIKKFSNPEYFTRIQLFKKEFKQMYGRIYLLFPCKAVSLCREHM